MTAAEKLAEAEAALHLLLTGTQTVEVQYGERRIKFTTATVADLRAYIAALKNEIAGNTRQPFQVLW